MSSRNKSACLGLGDEPLNFSFESSYPFGLVTSEQGCSVVRRAFKIRSLNASTRCIKCVSAFETTGGYKTGNWAIVLEAYFGLRAGRRLDRRRVGQVKATTLGGNEITARSSGECKFGEVTLADGTGGEFGATMSTLGISAGAMVSTLGIRAGFERRASI